MLLVVQRPRIGLAPPFYAGDTLVGKTPVARHRTSPPWRMRRLRDETRHVSRRPTAGQ
jgi:acyl dehydratase